MPENQDKQSEMADRRSKKWHVDKSVSIGHLAATAVLLITGLWWFVTNENRISQIEVSAEYREDRLTQVELTQITQAEWIATKLEQIRREQHKDMIRLSESMSDGFLRIERNMSEKADRP